ncbi:MAG TPA: c-type cytochrome [Burkholderiales bacterium]|nr:c-type cytochrome [Burkholderiales bacterium]
MNRHLVIFIAMTLTLCCRLSWGDEPNAETKKAAAKVAVELCSSCHGPRGESVSPQFPRLAGQQKLYLEGQLHALKDKSRADPEAHDFMWGIAGTLNDAIISGLAEYYASQPPMHGTPTASPALIAEGNKLFHNGVPSRNIPACASCHGDNAQGAAIFPRLAGQHSQYVVRQLTVIQDNLRKSPIMHGIVQDLSDNEKRAVAAYLESL